VTGGAILTGLATLAIQPHRHAPKGAVWLAVAVSTGALLVALTSPTGWAGSTTAASYVCASWTVLAVAAAVVRDRRVTNLVLLLVVAGVLVEMAEAWLAWWGGANPATPMSGTFYWFDPFAAFLIAGAVVGLSLWLRRTGPVAALGLVGCVLGTIGIIYSTSRAAGACFVLATVLIYAAHAFGRRMASVARSAIALSVTGASVWLVAGPPFFSHRVEPFAGTAARAASQSLGQNGGYRKEFWREAIGVFHRHPLTGGGYHSLATASYGHIPGSWALSPLAHNGYLQALSDGGLLLGVPFLIAALGIAWWVVTSLVTAVRSRTFSTEAFALPLALGAMLVHSAVDFDWSYAADFAVVAILAGVVAGVRWSTRPPRVSPSYSGLLTGAVLVGVALTGISAAAASSGDLRQSLPITHSASHEGTK
jgi:O-antigen ligase